jgi:hypothetical protein
MPIMLAFLPAAETLAAEALLAEASAPFLAELAGGAELAGIAGGAMAPMALDVMGGALGAEALGAAGAGAVGTAAPAAVAESALSALAPGGADLTTFSLESLPETAYETLTSADLPPYRTNFGMTPNAVTPASELPVDVDWSKYGSVEYGIDPAVSQETLWDKIKGTWGTMSPFQKGMATYMGINALSGLTGGQQGPQRQPYTGPLSRYRLSPDFKGSYPVRMAASGGIMELAKGGEAAEAAADYYKMMERQQRNIPQGRGAPKGSHDVGIYYDADPDTRRLDPLSAAQVRLAKINSRAGMQGMQTKRPTPLGQVNLRPQGVKEPATQKYQDLYAAKGGIMQASSSLGGYAAGGRPRLLSGPGDGMSDDIPAMIGRKQPARLADGEFVIPADVVSHLGNGSTKAGADKLHKMMTKVRKARTGNPKQGKQINPDKYLPKA